MRLFLQCPMENAQCAMLNEFSLGRSAFVQLRRYVRGLSAAPFFLVRSSADFSLPVSARYGRPDGTRSPESLSSKFPIANLQFSISNFSGRSLHPRVASTNPAGHARAAAAPLWRATARHPIQAAEHINRFWAWSRSLVRCLLFAVTPFPEFLISRFPSALP